MSQLSYVRNYSVVVSRKTYWLLKAIATRLNEEDKQEASDNPDLRGYQLHARHSPDSVADDMLTIALIEQQPELNAFFEQQEELQKTAVKSVKIKP